FGLLVFMAALYLVGTWINPTFFGNATALASVLRDAARFGVMAVGMSFVIINRDLDLSVGSTLGLVSVIFALTVAPTFYDLSPWVGVVVALVAGLAIGLVNGVLVTYLRVPAFIATLTMLFIGRGLVLGLTGGQNIGFAAKGDSAFFTVGITNGFGFNNQVVVFFLVAILGGFVLARTRWGYETYATGGNALAAGYAGVNTNIVRIRAFVISSLCATLAGLMNMAQDKGVHSQYGVGNELIVIAAVIIGGASILGGRGRIIGACMGAILIVLIDKVLREGVPITRVIEVSGEKMEVQAMAQLPPGAVPAFLGIILMAAVLIEPWVIRRRLVARAVARLRGLPPPPEMTETVAIEAARTTGTRATSRETEGTWFVRLLARREAAAVIFVVILWLIGFRLRPDFWGNLDNSFNLLLAFSEIGLMAVGMAYVMRNGDVDLSVGSTLAMAGATTAFLMKMEGMAPPLAALIGFVVGTMAGVVNGFLSTKAKLPAFVATLCMFYIARGIAAWLVAGRQLNQFPESYNLLGRKLIEVLKAWGMNLDPYSLVGSIAAALSTQTLILFVIAVVFGVILWKTPFGYMVTATGGNRRAAGYAGINTDRVRFLSLLFCSMCAALAGLIYVAFYRSFNPSAGMSRELDVIAAVVIGGASIFGGYGSVLGALAGALVITLLRALLSLQIITAAGSFVMPQHWVNVWIGIILIVAVLGDIWLRQEHILQRLPKLLRFRPSTSEATA
ncbi:MAG TPA: ABC transporter permease, partial [Methylomirabilota bacterium]|nr:ABC transporter permease [Methylomirabilota bacterium]